MEIIKVPIEFKEKFISIDGKTWNTRRQCEQYEELLVDNSILKDLPFYDKQGNRLDIFALKEIPDFCYLVLTQDIKNYDGEVIRMIIGGSGSGAYFRLPNTQGIWYNNWANAYNGRYGDNGWEKCLTIEQLHNEIKSCQEQIKFFEKISKTT
jgi:hypothetical protein